MFGMIGGWPVASTDLAGARPSAFLNTRPHLWLREWVRLLTLCFGFHRLRLRFNLFIVPAAIFCIVDCACSGMDLLKAQSLF
jgi:hypothetical protein